MVLNSGSETNRTEQSQKITEKIITITKCESQETEKYMTLGWCQLALSDKQQQQQQQKKNQQRMLGFRVV